jgi:hypothetical protein
MKMTCCAILYREANISPIFKTVHCLNNQNDSRKNYTFFKICGANTLGLRQLIADNKVKTLMALLDQRVKTLLRIFIQRDAQLR